MRRLPPAARSADLLARRAKGLVLAAALLFGLMAFAAKLAARQVPGGQVALIRFLLTLSPVLLIPSARRAATRIKRYDLLLYRGLFGGLAVLLYFLAIERIPVGTATLLNATQPIFSGLFSALFLAESFGAAVLLPLAAALTGVFLVVNATGVPAHLFGFGPWEAAALASGVLGGAAITAIRAARRQENSWSVLASFCVLGALVTAPFATADWRAPGAGAWALLGVVGALSAAAQLLMTYAYRWVDAVTAGVISQASPLVAMSSGVLFLGEDLSLQKALGTLLTLGGVIAVMLVTARPQPSGFDEPAEP
jgi:drug/metabolite transporter (DMT)-like permease